MNHKYLICDVSILPDCYAKVVEARSLVESGKAKDVSEAVRLVGISRSTYYKYKDFVFEYTHPLGNTVSLQATLKDKAGVLSNFLQVLYSCGGNILTVNQGLPASGVASVSVSLRAPADFDSAKLLFELKRIDGVVSVKQLHGE